MTGLCSWEDTDLARTTVQLGICNHQGKQPPLLTIPRRLQDVQGALKGTGGCANWRHGCTHGGDIQPPSSQAEETAGSEQVGFVRGFCDVGSCDLPILTCLFPLLPTQPMRPSSTSAPHVMVSQGCSPSPQEGVCCACQWFSHPQAAVPALLQNCFPAR